MWMNKQRKEIYAYRKEILQSQNIKEKILHMIDDIVEEIMRFIVPRINTVKNGYERH